MNINTQIAKTREGDPASNNEGSNQAHIPSIGEIGLNQFPPYLMNRIMVRWNYNLQEKMLESKLSTVKMRILAVLCVHSGLTIKQLSIFAVIEQSTISRSLDTMEKQGLIRRKVNSNDGRIREIHVMEMGRKMFNLFWPDMYANYKNLFSGISNLEQENFIQTLHKILNNIRENKV